jgi:hypothetical protein
VRPLPAPDRPQRGQAPTDYDGEDAQQHRGPVGAGLGDDGPRVPAVPAIFPTLPGGSGRGAGRGLRNQGLRCCKQGFPN